MSTFTQGDLPMPSRAFGLITVIAALSLASGCKSKEEKATDVRIELRTILDAAYAAYGGGSLAGQAKEKAKAEAKNPDPQAAESAATGARAVSELDRNFFEAYCVAHGRGERPFNLSDKLDGFMKDSKNVETCQKAAKLATKLEKLEAEGSK